MAPENKSKWESRSLRVTMPDGSRWDVPVMAIARHRAAIYAGEFGGDEERSLAEDTLALFDDDSSEIADWAANNMDWDDVASVAVRVPDEARPVDFQQGWVNGKKELVSHGG